MGGLKGLNLTMALLYSMFRWCTDNEQTPCLLFKPDADSELVISISKTATRNLVMYSNIIKLEASFSGRIKKLLIPFHSILSLYSLETGEGIMMSNSVLFGTSIRKRCGLVRSDLKVSFET